ncbi:phenylalanine--tRNA ligase subunit beta [Candidatus Phytoplasma sacchari]
MIINEKILKKYIPSLEINNIEKFKLLVNNHIIESSHYYNILNDNDNLIKIGKIIEFFSIKDKKNIYLVKVDIKTKIISVICSYNNIQINKKVIVALIGAYLFHNNEKIFVTKELFGSDIENEGIICSSLFLGLNSDYLADDEKEGILFLEKDAIIGECALEYLGIKGFFLDLSVTPDRNDLLSYIGFARDLKSILQNNKIELKERLNFSITEKKNSINPFKVEILTSNCFEYNIRYVKDIKITRSPLWLRNKLLSHKINPINNVLDVVNLILLEYGIPLDVFDSSFFEDNLILIRNANKNEYFYCNNEQQYILDDKDLVISNNNKIVSLSGIKTNFNYDISDKTKEFILCSFYFKPEFVLNTSRKIGIKNDKVLHLSRGIDQDLITKVLEKAIFLLQKISNCSVYKNIVSLKKDQHINPIISLSLELIFSKTGINFSFEQVYNFLIFLNYKVEKISNKFFKVQAPSNHYYVKIAEDVISDLIRIYGYDKILSKKNAIKKISIKEGVRSLKEENICKLRKLLSNLGLNEIITYSLVNDKTFFLFPSLHKPLIVLKPLSYDKTFLRQNLSASLLDVLSFNQRNKNFDNFLFEIGNIYIPEQEIPHLSIILSGNFINTGWLKKDIQSSFFLLKGFLDRIQFLFGVKFDLIQTSSCDVFLPTQQSDIFLKDKKIGFIGETHPIINKKYHINKSFMMEINIQDILVKKRDKITFKEVTKFNSITRDLSFFVNKKYNFQQLHESLKDEISCFFIECELLDFFQDNSLSTEEYSLTFRLIFNNNDKNLNKQEINYFMEKIESKMKKKYKIKIR